MQLQDYEPGRRRFLEDVLRGLDKPCKELPCKYFYDERGSELFEAICELDEYYPTRTELAITRRYAGEMAARLGRGCLLIEYGSGSSQKTRILLDALEQPVAYVPIDISREQLRRSAADLSEAYPRLEVLPVCADYTADYEVPQPRRTPERRVVYFPGSTIGNFPPKAAIDFLRHVAEVCGAGGGLLVGVDLKKPARVLDRAYNDERGITASFNRNLLARINRELGGDFALERFEHEAVWEEDEGCVAMYLVSRGRQRVRIGAVEIELCDGERILTERSYKYARDEFAALGAAADLGVEAVWTDPREWFSVQYLAAR